MWHAEHRAIKRRRPQLHTVDEVWSDPVCNFASRPCLQALEPGPVIRGASCHEQAHCVQAPACSLLDPPAVAEGECASGRSLSRTAVLHPSARSSVELVSRLVGAFSTHATTAHPSAGNAQQCYAGAVSERLESRLSLSPITPRPARTGSCPTLLLDVSASLQATVPVSHAVQFQTPSRCKGCSSCDRNARLWAPLKGSPSPSLLVAARRLDDSSSDEETSPRAWTPEYARLHPGLEEVPVPSAGSSVPNAPGKENAADNRQRRSACNPGIICNLVERFDLVDAFNHAQVYDSYDRP
jgi:hypothetical protein